MPTPNARKVLVLLAVCALTAAASFYPPFSFVRHGYTIANNFVSQATSVLMTLTALWLILLFAGLKDSAGEKAGSPALLLVVVAGTCIRLGMAYYNFGNQDMINWLHIAQVVERGGHVYTETTVCNYSPFIPFFFSSVLKLTEAFKVIPFHFILKSFMIMADLWALLAVVNIARCLGLPVLRTAIFFYLNPISFLLTGFHGQTDPLVLACVLTGVWMYLRDPRGRAGKWLLWFFSSLGLFVKQSFFYTVIVCLNAGFRRKRSVFLLFGLSSALFLLSFWPVWKEQSEGIVRNVFFYASIQDVYGLAALPRNNVFWPVVKNLFIGGLFVLPFFIQKKSLVGQCLAMLLFFLSFTVGFGIQYLVMPVAFGALKPSRGFLVYTVIASLAILGSYWNVDNALFRFIPLHAVWAAALFWFWDEMKGDETLA